MRDRGRPEGDLPPALAPGSIETLHRMASSPMGEERAKVRHAINRDPHLARLLDQDTLRGLLRADA